MTGNAPKNKGSSFWWALPAKATSVLKSPQRQRRTAWAVGGLLLLWALAYAAVPSILKSPLEKIASEKLGRQVTVGAVDFKPWSLELTLSDLAVAKARPAGAPASFAADSLNARPRARHGFNTPLAVFAHLLAMAQQAPAEIH